jgi:hypothetical protein
MNVAYVYLQLYRLFDSVTPIDADCGACCKKACCKGDGGMYLFPGEKRVYDLLKPDWVTVEKSDFSYTSKGKEYIVPIALCNGQCDRYQRPLACRIFPLTPYIETDGTLSIITDPRAKPVCPLSDGLLVNDYNRLFVKNIKKAFALLSQNAQVRAFLKAYSSYLDEFRKFF